MQLEGVAQVKKITNNIGLIAIRKIEAAQEITDTLSKNPNIMFVSEKSPNMLMIPASPGVIMKQATEAKQS